MILIIYVDIILTSDGIVDMERLKNLLQQNLRLKI